MTFNEMKMYPKIILSSLGYNQTNIKFNPNQTLSNDCKPVVNSPRKSFYFLTCVLAVTVNECMLFLAICNCSVFPSVLLLVHFLFSFQKKEKYPYQSLTRQVSFFLFCNSVILVSTRAQCRIFMQDCVTRIGHFGEYHNILCLSAQILHNHCFQFVLALTMVPRENKKQCLC